MDIEKKEVKVEVKADAAAPKAPVAAKKPAAKKPAAKKPAAKKAAKKPAAKKAAAPAKKAAAKKPAAKKPAAKKVAKKPAKKAAAPKKVEIFFQIDGQEISNAAIAKKLPKAAKIWVNAAEKKAYDESGKGVDLF